jgi:hypothetical protein
MPAHYWSDSQYSELKDNTEDVEFNTVNKGTYEEDIALATRLSNLPLKYILNTLIPITYPGGRGTALPALETSADT